MSGLGSRIDWYEPTMDDADDGRVAAALALATGSQLSRGKARNGYGVAHNVERAGEQLATVYGRSARLGEVHVAVSGESCDEVVPILRRLYPAHRVSRADAAVDFAADFDVLDAQLLAFATDRGLSHRLITSSDGGATRYVGAPSSEVRMRLYKKSEQLMALHPERAGDVPAGIVRAEVQVRPGKRASKERLGRSSADDVWGFAQWAAELAQLVLSITAERVSTHFRRPSDYARALHFVGIQYGPTFQRRAGEVGADVALSELREALGL